MAASSATVYYGFMIVSTIISLWITFILCSRLFAWMLIRVLGISVGFRIGSWKCLRDVVVKSETGAFQSASADKIKFGVAFLSGELNIQILICDLGVVMSSSAALFCDKLSLSCQVGYDRAVGMMVIRNMEIVSANVTMNLEDDLFSETEGSSATASSAMKPHKEHQLSALTKYSTYFPEKVSFSLTKLDVRCVSREHDLFAENNVTGIKLRSVKSKSVEDTRESTRFDVQMELNEIHLFREAESSILKIIKVVVVSSIEIPIQLVLPINAEVEMKLGGTRFDLLISRLEPWLRLLFLEKRNLVLQGETRTLEKSKATDMKTLMWRGTVSAPEMTVLLYGTDDLPLYHFCSQSSHVFANNISSIGTAIDVELGELNLHLADEYQENFKDNIFGTVPNIGLLMHVAKISLNCARRDCRSDLVLSVSVTRMRIYLSYKRVECFITNAISFKALFKTLSFSGEKTMNKTGGVQLSNASEKGTRLVNLNLKRCYVIFFDDTGLDPKSDNYGEQSTSSILSTTSKGCKRLKYSVSLEVTRFRFCLNKDKHSIQMEFSRAKSIYQEHKPCPNVTLFDMHNTKLTRQSGGLDVFYLLSATYVSLGWEPDVHLSFYELFLRLRSLVYAQSVKEHECESDSVDEEMKKESIFATDVEMLTISAKVGDGVEVKFEVRSIFTENACIGVLVEGLMLAFSGSRVLKTKRMQISRIPTASSDLSDVVNVRTSGPWDWVVQGVDVSICMPYKLQLCAIADLIEEMLGDLMRLITVAKEKYIFSGKRESLQPKKSSPNVGRIILCIQRLTAYIEEEPFQGWLDEHYQLMKKEACELAVRLRFLEDFIKSHEGVETSTDPSGERKMTFDGVEIDVHNSSAINKVKEQIHKRSFRSYYHACHGLFPTEGSGSCNEGFQAGFKPSAARNSLLSVSATDFDLRLEAVCDGSDDDAGLIENLKNLDLSCEEISGNKVDLKTGSLVVKLRNYTHSLFSATSCKCEGRIMTFPIAQEAMSFQPQTSQDVFVGSGNTTQSMKTYSDLRIYFEQGEVSFGVGYEPAFADISYALTVALSQRNPSVPQASKEEQSLSWWDTMRNYVHGNITLSFSESKWTVLATTDPYESQDKLQILTGPIEFQHSDSRVFVNARDFKIKLSSLESLISHYSGVAFFEAPVFNLEVKMDWECESRSSLNVLDPLRSTSVSLQWSLSLRPKDKNENMSLASPVMNLGAHNLAWILKFCGMNCDPPLKLRSFSGWPRFGVPRAAVPEGLSLDQVMTEFMLRVDSTPFLVKYMPCDLDDPAKGLTFNMTKLKYELCYSRGKQKYTLECKRDALDLVYQGLEVHVPKAFIKKDEHKEDEKHRHEGFLLSSDYITIRRHAPNADHERLLEWQEAGRRNLEKTYVQSEFENDEHIRSDSSDDDGYNVVLADNCQRVFVYGLKLLWTIENRDAVFSFVGGISKAFEPPKPSPSRQYIQRKILEESQKDQEDILRSSASHGENQNVVETSVLDEEGTSHFMVNFINPQFNLHGEEANGRFLLAAVSGRVLARSFQSIKRVGAEVIEQTLATTSIQSAECIPKIVWTRMEISVILERVQAHVAPTDVDPGAGVQWLPKIRRYSPKVKCTGALLERVFMPCDMYLRYTRHKGVTPDFKVKPLEEVAFNSHNITATMTSRQFQVMVDVLTNLVFARLPKPRKSCLHCPTEDDDVEDEDVEDEADEVVPYSIEVELAKINLEVKEREHKLLLDDIRKLSHCSDNMKNTHMDKEGDLWMISTRRSVLVQRLKKELLYAQKSRKMAYASLRMALQKAANLRLMEKEKNTSASYATRICLTINKVVWSMIVDGRSFVEAEINDMIYDFDRDYKDIGVARFTTKYFVVRNCLWNAKSEMVLSAWNPPVEWGKKFMLRVDAKQGAPKDRNYTLELLHVEIYPLRIHLSETMYIMMWEYFFPAEERGSQRPKEVEKISTTAGSSKRVNKVLASPESLSCSAALSASAKMQSHSNDDCVQKSNMLNIESSTDGSAQKLKRTSSFDTRWEQIVAESVANELVLQSHSCAVSSSSDQLRDSSKHKLKKTKPVKSRGSYNKEKKTAKSKEEMMEFQNIRISQVELLVTYEGSRFVVSDLKLLMDTFVRAEFTGTWRRLFSHVKKHIKCGVLKSVIGMQGKKFTGKSQYKSHKNRESSDDDLKLSDNGETLFKRQSDGAGDEFVTSVRGVLNTQRRKPKAFVLRTIRGEAEDDFNGEWSDSDVEFSRQLTIAKAKRLIRRHTKKFRVTSQRSSTSQQIELVTNASDTSSSSESSPYEDFCDD